ncbi:MAG: G-D-S-L family lipolytic protein [Lyngbya sp. HA4199-MV5]|jgi:lysophospholipase L1-like esterase|nr:G-D-S-L family lipolytic protein [Lyngbya sp. HA4199-MV5]
MPDLSLLATVLTKSSAQQPSTSTPPPTAPLMARDWKAAPLRQTAPSEDVTRSKAILKPNVQPDSGQGTTEFSQPAIALPRSGSQLYWQRVAALRSGRLYTRLPINSFHEIWSRATRNPTDAQWRRLLALEAKAATRGQGSRRLSVMVGDSLSLWFPSDRLPTGQLWLNQAISGETTQAILHRLPTFAVARPQAIYVMAGVNDLKQGATDNDILWNLRQIARRLKQAHPGAQIVLQSILPTHTAMVPGNRIGWLNQRLAAIAQEDGVAFLDLYTQFTDDAGNLRPELTTDGLHLNANGYATWQAQLAQADTWFAQRS